MLIKKSRSLRVDITPFSPLLKNSQQRAPAGAQTFGGAEENEQNCGRKEHAQRDHQDAARIGKAIRSGPPLPGLLRQRDHLAHARGGRGLAFRAESGHPPAPRDRSVGRYAPGSSPGGEGCEWVRRRGLICEQKQLPAGHRGVSVDCVQEGGDDPA